ncbi:hypothetical protein PFISCL1PPCAC_12118, partial [Pristionchus fissidentatus]
RMLILSNEKIRNGKNKLIADKYFTLDGKLFIMNVNAGQFDPRMPIRMYEIINGRKVNEVGVHYSIGIPWINMSAVLALLCTKVLCTFGLSTAQMIMRYLMMKNSIMMRSSSVVICIEDHSSPMDFTGLQ